MVEAMALADEDTAMVEVAEFYVQFSDMMLRSHVGFQAWRLQTLTNLDELPDYEEGYFGRNDAGGAAVDAKGNPVFHHEPKSWDAATSDGERWRWCLAKAAKVDPKRASEAAWRHADFLYRQFGVQTMQQSFMPRAFEDNDDTPQTYALHTLKENETIAKLATGVKRFEFPEEFNYIRILNDQGDRQ